MKASLKRTLLGLGYRVTKSPSDKNNYDVYAISSKQREVSGTEAEIAVWLVSADEEQL